MNSSLRDWRTNGKDGGSSKAVFITGHMRLGVERFCVLKWSISISFF